MKTVNQLINYFKKIPKKDWTVETWEDDATGQKCFLGHLGLTADTSEDINYNEDTKTVHELFTKLFENHTKLQKVTAFNGLDVSMCINDDSTNKYYPQKHPKSRMLAALKDIKTLCKRDHVKNIKNKTNATKSKSKTRTY